MKMKCILNHEVPQENGKFKVYEAGQIYEVDIGLPNFEPIYQPPAQGLDFNPQTKRHLSKKNKHEEVIGDDSN
jgi:hypothetical protein